MEVHYGQSPSSEILDLDLKTFWRADEIDSRRYRYNC